MDTILDIPLKDILPEVGLMKPQIEFNNVVFPAPFSPISATIE